MSSPFATVDTIVHDQLKLYSPLLAVVGANRIRFSTRHFDLREVNQTGDEFPVIWVNAALSEAAPFVDTDSHDFNLRYEINLIVPHSKVSDMRLLEWLVVRALSWFVELKDAAGVTLSSSNPTPLKWKSPTYSDWTHALEEGVQRSVLTLNVPLTGDPDDIKNDAAVAPTAISAYITPDGTNKQVIGIIYFDQQISSAWGEKPLAIETNDGTSAYAGTGRSGHYSADGSSRVIFWGNERVASADPALIAYDKSEASSILVGTSSGLAVEDFTITPTVIV